MRQGQGTVATQSVVCVLPQPFPIHRRRLSARLDPRADSQRLRCISQQGRLECGGHFLSALHLFV